MNPAISPVLASLSTLSITDTVTGRVETAALIPLFSLQALSVALELPDTQRAVLYRALCAEVVGADRLSQTYLPASVYPTIHPSARALIRRKLVTRVPLGDGTWDLFCTPLGRQVGYLIAPGIEQQIQNTADEDRI